MNDSAAIVTTALGAFVGAVLSLLLSILIEYQRKPKLYFTIEDPPVDSEYPNAPAAVARFVRVQLWNKPMPPVLRWLGRNAAMHCNGEIQFHHFDDGAPVFRSPMPARWAGSDEPLSPHVLPDGRIVPLFDLAKYNAASRRNCYPGTKETLDVAARFDDDEACYGWSNENYLPDKGWRNKERELPRGRYLVRITVYSAGEKISEIYKLENSVARAHFRLMDADERDKEKVQAVAS